MATQHRPRLTWTTRLAVAITAVASVVGMSTVIAPTAQATVFSSCTMSRCTDARSANSIWQSKGYPITRGWYSWPNGQCNFAGGVFRNAEGQLPSGDSFQEFDVYPRSCGASRDAYRIVRDRNTGVVWFSPNHYTDFYRI